MKTEKRDGTSTSNPYVAFRRRAEKMQTRKVSFHDMLAAAKTQKLINWNLLLIKNVMSTTFSVYHRAVSFSLKRILSNLNPTVGV